MIQIAPHGRVTVITLNRPAKRNALNTELCHRLREAVTGAVSDGTRAIVLTGAGTSFCSGADLGEVYGAGFRAALYAMLHAVTGAPVPVVAAVNGPAIGAGTQLAIAADLRVAAPAARFAVPTAKLGLAADPWTIRRLALLAGNGTARALLLACDELDADAARRCGLAERTGSAEQAIEWAAGMTTLAPLSIAYSKQVLNAAFEPPLHDEALDAAFEACWASADFAEGRRARAERRPPAFEGR
jgi:enoyl-CoA hydratase